MATIKSYTDLEQSRKLAEILPLESADMFHFIHEVDTVGFGYKKDAAEHYSKTEFEYLPCWSLAVLLKFVCEVKRMDYSDKWEAASWNKSTTEQEYYVDVEDYDNPVGACYEMIIKLHELNLL